MHYLHLRHGSSPGKTGSWQEEVLKQDLPAQVEENFSPHMVGKELEAGNKRSPIFSSHAGVPKKWDVETLKQTSRDPSVKERLRLPSPASQGWLSRNSLLENPENSCGSLRKAP